MVPCNSGEASREMNDIQVSSESPSAEAAVSRWQKQKVDAERQVTTMMDCVERMQNKLMSTALPGEEPITAKTPVGLEMSLVM